MHTKTKDLFVYLMYEDDFLTKLSEFLFHLFSWVTYVLYSAIMQTSRTTEKFMASNQKKITLFSIRKYLDFSRRNGKLSWILSF